MQGGAPGELRPDLSCERFTLFVRELGVHKLSGVHNVRGHLLGHRLHKCGEHHIWNRGGGACASKLLEVVESSSSCIMGGAPASSSSDPDITSSADAGILCRPLHPVPSSLLEHFAA